MKRACKNSFLIVLILFQLFFFENSVAGSEDVWGTLSEGLSDGGSDYLTTYHISGERSSAEFSQNAQWLNMNIMQSGHMTAYWSVFVGACGVTYGSNNIWMFYDKDDRWAFWADRSWKEAVDDLGSFQMQYLKNLVLSRPYLTHKYKIKLT